MSTTKTPYQPKLWTPGDWNAFFGFGTNILVNLLTLTALLRYVIKLPDDIVFGRILPATGLMLFQHLIDTKGETEALLWLRSEHTGREMAEVRKASGIFKNHEKLQQYLPSETNLNESKLGVYMFGPKVGDFARDYDHRVNGLASHFVWTNRAKESLTLDVKHPSAAGILQNS